MKKEQILLIIYSMVCAMFVLTSCDEVTDNPTPEPAPEPTPEVKITNISITGTEITAEGTTILTVGTKLQLAVEITPSDAQNTKLTWKSSNEAMLTITDDGLLTTLKAGTVTVSVSPIINPLIKAQIIVSIIDDKIDVDEEVVDQSKADTRTS